MATKEEAQNAIRKGVRKCYDKDCLREYANPANPHVKLVVCPELMKAIRPEVVLSLCAHLGTAETFDLIRETIEEFNSPAET